MKKKSQAEKPYNFDEVMKVIVNADKKVVEERIRNAKGSKINNDDALEPHEGRDKKK